MGVINGPAQVPANAEDLATVCALCSHNCAMRVDVEDNQIVKVRADKSSPLTRGYSCNKGYRIAYYVNHKQRVEYPMKRRADGSFERISWDQAIKEIGAKLKDILAKHPGRSLALAGIGGQANHMDGPFAIPFLWGAGSDIIFNALGQEKTQHPLVDGWLFGAPPDVFFHPDSANTQYMLMMGTNPVVSNRGERATETIRDLRADDQRTLVVVDPRQTETTRRANRHLRIKPGKDVYLMLALCAHIERAGLTDKEFIGKYAKDYEKLREVLRGIDIRDMAVRTGLDVSEITEVAEGFARAPSAAILADLGVEQIPYSTLMSYLMRVMLIMTGNVGNRGGQVFLPGFSPKVPAAALERRKQPRALASDIPAIPMLTPIGWFSPNLLPEEILVDDPGRIRALIVEGANPLVSYADSQRHREAFDKLDLLVVIDPAFTETAQVADYVLPTPVGYEKWEYAGFPKGFPEVGVQLRPPVVRGPDEALPEAEIYYRLAREMGIAPKAPRALHLLAKGARSPLGAPLYFAALGSLAALRGGGGKAIAARFMFWLYETLGPLLPSPQLVATWSMAQGYAATRKADIVREFPEVAKMRNPFAIGEFLFQKILDHPEGVHVGRVDAARSLEKNLTHADGRIRIFPAQMGEEIASALADTFPEHENYPFILDGGMRTIWNANTIQRDPAWRKGKGPFCPVLLHPDDARALGVATGDRVRIETSRGAAEAPVHVDESTRTGHIHVPNGFGLEYPDPETGELKQLGVRVNELTDAGVRDRFTGCPHHKHIRCRVSAVKESAASPAA